MAGSQIPSDSRVALPRGTELDQKGTPELRGGGALWGSTRSCLCSCVLPSFGAGQQEPDKDAAAFRVSPNSGLLEARLVNGPPNTITLQVFFTARYQPLPAFPKARAPFLTSASDPHPHRSSMLYESTLVVEGMLGEKACTLRLRGQGSYDEKYMSPHQL